MKHLIAVLIAFCMFVSFTNAQDSLYGGSPLELHTLPALSSLAHACEIVRNINSLHWEEVKVLIKSRENFLPILIKDSERPEWHGIGSYRGTDKEGETIKHRFIYGPRRNYPHELQLIYSIKDDNLTFKEMTILGW